MMHAAWVYVTGVFFTGAAVNDVVGEGWGILVLGLGLAFLGIFWTGLVMQERKKQEEREESKLNREPES